ncbi:MULTISPECIES: hypothetical protein [unclassified Streptomyces]|uniref:hypothetical protein n=1 Tax=unclassified Streptomyces TaxID=2593676 RepID=UPI002E2A0D70|nr:hypothetical protein [Streptomyces sp. NBC_00223]
MSATGPSDAVPGAPRLSDAVPGGPRPPARRGIGPGLVIWLVVFCGLWTLFGYGLADAARYPVGTTYLLADLYPANSTPPLLWALFTGAFAGGAVGSLVHGPLERWAGVGAATTGQLAVALSGIALGVLLGADFFWVTAPDTGTYVNAAGRSGASWGAGAWIGWSSRYWVPGALGLLAVVLAVVAVRAARTARRRPEGLRDRPVPAAVGAADR